MKQITLFLFYITGLSFVRAQVPMRGQLVGNWIGVRIEYDQLFSRPYPICLKLDADSTYTLSLIDEKSPVRQATWSIASQTIRLDTNTYALNQWALRGDTLRLTGAYPTIFRRLADIPIDSSAVRQTLTGYTWSSDSLTYYFYSDGSACIETPRTGDMAAHCWRLAQIERSVFLVIKGRATDCDGNFQYPIQVTQLSSNKVELLGGSQGINHFALKRGMALKATEHCQPKGFQPCNSYVFASVNLYPYFSYQRGRLYDIRQVVEREYKPVLQSGQSGLIRFRFIVNCQGEAGQFDMLEVDDNYQKFSFDPRITRQLLNICRHKLTDWEPGKTNRDQLPVDTFCLLTFRLKDGLITDIFP